LIEGYFFFRDREGGKGGSIKEWMGVGGQVRYGVRYRLKIRIRKSVNQSYTEVIEREGSQFVGGLGGSTLGPDDPRSN